MYQLHSAVINAFARIFLNVFSAKKFHTEQVSYLQIKLYAQDFHLCAKLPYCALQNFWRTNRLHPQNAVYNLRLLTSPYIFVHIRDVLFLGNIRLKISSQSSKFSSIFELFKKKSNNSMLLNYIAAKIVRFIASMTQTSYITPLYVSYRLLP